MEQRVQIPANIDRLNAFMDRNELAAVVARSGQNFTYLSGMAYPGTLQRMLDLTDSPRGTIVLWPRKGDPVVILNKTAVPYTQRESPITRLEVYQAYIESPYKRLCSVIQEAGLQRERIGIEKSYVSAAHLEEVRKLLPHATFFDCTRMMDEVRWIKTPAEIELLRSAANLLDDAYLEVFPKVRPGDTEREVHSRIVASCLRRGAGWVHGILASSRNTVNYGGESDLALQKGDVIRDDYIAYYTKGYPGHQSRNVVLGKPSDALRSEYHVMRDIYRGTLERCQPGTRCGDVFAFVEDEFRKHGWEYKPMLVGHGVGSWWHQQEPILARGSDIVLEEGMVLAMEPHKGHWHIQDMIVVRKGGPENLSTKFPTEEMLVIE
jgi:Xaa-Pro aminopeptidase